MNERGVSTWYTSSHPPSEASGSFYTYRLSRYAGFAVLPYIFNDDKGSPVVVELFFILLLDVYSSSSGLQLIDGAQALAYILPH